MTFPYKKNLERTFFHHFKIRINPVHPTSHQQYALQKDT